MRGPVPLGPASVSSAGPAARGGRAEQILCAQSGIGLFMRHLLGGRWRLVAPENRNILGGGSGRLLGRMTRIRNPPLRRCRGSDGRRDTRGRNGVCWPGSGHDAGGQSRDVSGAPREEGRGEGVSRKDIGTGALVAVCALVGDAHGQESPLRKVRRLRGDEGQRGGEGILCGAGDRSAVEGDSPGGEVDADGGSGAAACCTRHLLPSPSPDPLCRAGASLEAERAGGMTGGAGEGLQKSTSLRIELR